MPIVRIGIEETEQLMQPANFARCGKT